MKKVLVFLFAGAFIASVLVLNFGKMALFGNNAIGNLLLEEVESAAYTPGYVENPGPGDTSRRAMPVECNDGHSGWKVKTGCCTGTTSCSYNPCPGIDIRGC
jgi:hypothetical protein